MGPQRLLHISANQLLDGSGESGEVIERNEVSSRKWKRKKKAKARIPLREHIASVSKNGARA